MPKPSNNGKRHSFALGHSSSRNFVLLGARATGLISFLFRTSSFHGDMPVIGINKLYLKFQDDHMLKFTEN